MGNRPYISTSVRQFVEERAQGCCEYCRLHQDDVSFSHTVDHIIALKHGGASDESNLALACWECNLNKGSDLTTFDPLTGALVRLYHPRLQIWTGHFLLDGAHIVGITPHGRATIHLLRFNLFDRIQQRQQLLQIGRYQT